MSEKTFLVEIGTEELPPKHCAARLSPLLRTLLRSWITLASHTAPFNGLLLRVVWRLK